MRTYDPSQPLIFIHVPKTAGIAVRRIVEGWFPGGLHLHYYNEATATMPPRRTLTGRCAVYGHFNGLRGFGIRDYYPQVDQFVTILRDPFETAISTYFYVRKDGVNWRDQERVPQADLEAYLREARPNILNHFPREMTMQNYRDVMDELFVEVGVTERLPESLGRIATALGQVFDPASLETLNATPRDQTVGPQWREMYAERYPLEFAVYEYALARFAS